VRLGIDFGTTRTVVAVADRGNYPVVTFEGDHEGQGSAFTAEWFPSVVAEREGELRFGLDALDVARDPSWTLLRSFKRLLGPDAASSGRVTLGSIEIGTAELVTRFLESLMTALRTRSNLSRSLKKVTRVEAVVATPANAFCTQRFLTLEAFRRAGFDVRAMLNEPSAAGFEYAHRHARTLSSAREHVVVYDLGGGTFDASLVRMSGAHHDVVTTSGIGQLGGDDFDRVLAELVLARAKIKKVRTLDALAPAQRDRLLDECRAAKEALSASSRKVAVDLDDVFESAKNAPGEISIPVADYYEACTPLLERTLEALRPVLASVGGDLDAEGVPSEVAGLYVVGGASSLPVIGRLLRARFGRRVHRSPYPHAAVAIGLAIAGDDAAGFELVDRFSRNFGVFREEEGGARASYDPILTRELALPKPGEPPVTIRRRYRAMHDVGHYRFFECAAFDASGAPRGEIAPLTDVLFPFEPSLRDRQAELARWPVQRLDREGPLVEERYAVDASGMVEVTIVDLDSGFARTERLGAVG
jgi:molecular chaperone DnaK (HSP70)